jgi:ribosomal protein L7/L12
MVTVALAIVVAAALIILALSLDASVDRSQQREKRAPRDIDHLARSGKLIDAIKEYRRQHGVGLQEAKDAVEKLRRQ